jgi:hypothetical protein
MRSIALPWLTLALSLAACSGASDGALPFGETAIVTVVNPLVNAAHTVGGPVPADARASISIDVIPGGAATTDATGLAVVKDLTPGVRNLLVGTAATSPFTISAAGDVYDLAVAYDGTTTTPFPGFPIRYGVGGRIVVLDSRASPAAVAEALSTDGNVVFFRNGTFLGDLVIAGSDVILFGEDLSGREAVIDGSVTVQGTGVRIRGFTITGDVTVPGNDFGMAFATVHGATALHGNGIALLRNVLCGDVTVPSSNASLLDNAGLEPIALPAGACP